jgi:hypothetical protein
MLASLALLCVQTPAVEAKAEDPLAKCLWIGFSIKAYGDWDHDGHADFLVSAPRTWESGMQPTVALVSGADGHSLLSWRGDTWFGLTLDVIGDVDGDHLPEIVVSGGATAKGFGTQVFSSKDGALRYGLPSGFAVTVPDVNGDGITDFVALAARMDDAGKYRTTALEFRSGADGSSLRNVVERNPSPVALLGIPDCNGDGCSDIVALFRATPDPMIPHAELEMISGKDGATIGRRTFDVQCTQPVLAMVDAGEPDHDGKPQIAVSLLYNKGATWLDHRSGALPAGTVSVLSTPSLQTHFVLEAKDAVTCNGYSLCGGADLNGDGHRDILVSEYPDARDKKASKPRLRIYSGSDGALLRSVEGVRNFGRTVSWVGDVDKDGTPDYAVASLYDRDPTDIDFDQVDVFSGKTGAPILTVPKPPPPKDGKH